VVAVPLGDCQQAGGAWHISDLFHVMNRLLRQDFPREVLLEPVVRPHDARVDPAQAAGFPECFAGIGLLLRHWFRAHGTFSDGAGQGFRDQARLTLRPPFAFRPYPALKPALDHTFDHLHEPRPTSEYYDEPAKGEPGESGPVRRVRT
jgi:hypothetical protein